MLHTFTFQISLIKWRWSVSLLSLSSLESWICPLNTAWDMVHICPLLLGCPTLHPPLTSAAVKSSPFLHLAFSQSFLIKDLKRWIFSRYLPCFLRCKEISQHLSLYGNWKPPRALNPRLHIKCVMWEMTQAQVILVHEKDLEKSSPPSEQFRDFTSSLWRWTLFGHDDYSLGIQIFLSF